MIDDDGDCDDMMIKMLVIMEVISVSAIYNSGDNDGNTKVPNCNLTFKMLHQNFKSTISFT